MLIEPNGLDIRKARCAILRKIFGWFTQKNDSLPAGGPPASGGGFGLPMAPGQAEQEALFAEKIEAHGKWLQSSGARGERADMAGAHLETTSLFMVNLTKADLREARLAGANAQWANLDGADLTGANLEEADLFQSSLEGANLTNARMAGANMMSAGLKFADLTGADLSGADLRGASLQRTKLAGANLTGALVDDADLELADIRGVDLSGVKGLTPEQAEGALKDAETLFPDV
ncbi:MAG: pentapeptide repeat-containing protein [Nitrospinae bacterium]|nr:pentapeptide repeat-containing protein [Nitrospinota bacterium]